MRAYKDAGAQLVMLTVKHHDGFVLYPTRYTDHSIVASPWWNGDASRDVLGSYVRAARDAGLRVGIYLSPSDGAEQPHDWHAAYVQRIREKQESGQPLSKEEQVTLEDGDRAPGGRGRYGNGGPVAPRTIPTLVEGDDRADEVADGRLPSFAVQVDDYNAFYLNQIYELPPSTARSTSSGSTEPTRGQGRGCRRTTTSRRGFGSSSRRPRRP